KVMGLIKARDNLLKKLGDLSQALGDPEERNLALTILLGGVKEECVSKGAVIEECIPPNSIAGIYRKIFGIGLGSDYNEDVGNLNKLINMASIKGLQPEIGKGLGIRK
ncbi:MAG: hypothetical protein ACP5NQ_04540, partial [Vulcanisaeta sp.]